MITLDQIDDRLDLILVNLRQRHIVEAVHDGELHIIIRDLKTVGQGFLSLCLIHLLVYRTIEVVQLLIPLQSKCTSLVLFLHFELCPLSAKELNNLDDLPEETVNNRTIELFEKTFALKWIEFKILFKPFVFVDFLDDIEETVTPLVAQFPSETEVCE